MMKCLDCLWGSGCLFIVAIARMLKSRVAKSVSYGAQPWGLNDTGRIRVERHDMKGMYK